jgi:Condensation domain
LAYHLAPPLRLRGQLNMARLHRAIGQLHRRHGTLRTTYHDRGSQRIQKVHGSFEHVYAEVDASSGEEDDLVNLAQREFGLPFDLTQAPSHVTLYRRASDDHLLLCGCCSTRALHRLQALHLRPARQLTGSF